LYVSDNRGDVVEDVLLSLNGIPTMGMYKLIADEQFQLWRRYYTSTDTATTTILAAGLVEGIPSSLSWDT
jgi:hypothetical protein